MSCNISEAFTEQYCSDDFEDDFCILLGNDNSSTPSCGSYYQRCLADTSTGGCNELFTNTTATQQALGTDDVK